MSYPSDCPVEVNNHVSVEIAGLTDKNSKFGRVPTVEGCSVATTKCNRLVK